ncbi:MAG: MFS transporter [Hyphomicrobiales bacterium]|nr:MFS transporter [Hyphomicrobiales bacterium]
MQTDASLERAARRQMTLINSAHLLTHYSLLILPTAVLAMARPGGPFGADYGPIVALATGMFVLYGAGSLPQGWLAQRVGRPRLMLAFYVGTGLSLLAASAAPGPWALAGALSFAGFFAAIYHPIGTAMLVEAAGDKPGRALGLNGVFGNVGVASAPLVTAFLSQQIGWRWGFALPGLVCIALGIAWMGQREMHIDHEARAKNFPVIPAPIVRRAVITMLAVSAASGLVFNAYTILLPKLMEERLAGDARLLPVVGALAFAVTLCGALTQFTVGRLIDHMTLKRIFMPLALALTPCLALLAFARGWVALPLAGLVAAVVFGQVTINETMTARYISPAMRAKIYSLRFFIGFLGGAASAPIVGYLHERTGSLTLVVLCLAVMGLVTLACALGFPDRREELEPALWAQAQSPAPVAAE